MSQVLSIAHARAGPSPPRKWSASPSFTPATVNTPCRWPNDGDPATTIRQFDPVHP